MRPAKPRPPPLTMADLNPAKTSKKTIGRFAPTPSGPLHMGSLVAALASYVDAKHDGGDWLLRIEDVDEQRSTRNGRDQIIAALRRFGFEWDGEIVEQSLRKAFYRTAIDQLQESGLLYACKCSRGSLVDEPTNVSGEPFYPGRCRERGFEKFGQVSQRILVKNSILRWTDLNYGKQSQNLAKDVGDFVVRRTDGLFTYQLAVVVDDAAQGITRVVRGADLLSSTARQIFLQRSLQLPTPEYLHIPVLVNPRGEKLSKSSLAAALPASHELPVLHTAWNALGQLPITDDIATPKEFLQRAAQAWDRSRLAKTPTVPYMNPG